jgi:hypothetical protein
MFTCSPKYYSSTLSFNLYSLTWIADVNFIAVIPVARGKEAVMHLFVEHVSVLFTDADFS